MTHRTMTDIGGATIEVFDTAFAAQRWIKKTSGDCRVLARNTFYFQRKEGFEMTIRLNATDCLENLHLVRAACAIADQVESEIAAMAKAAA